MFPDNVATHHVSTKKKSTIPFRPTLDTWHAKSSVFIATNNVKICENHSKQNIKTNGWVQGLWLHVHMSFHVCFIGTHGSCSKHVPCMRF
jgi:hypothetical protein